VHAKLEASESELATVRLRLMDAESKADSAQSAATSRAAKANEQSQRASEQIGEYETKLAELRAELEEKKSELQAVRLQLTDANDGGAKSSSKAEKLCAENTAGPVNTDDRILHMLVERMRAMETEMESMRGNEKSIESMVCRNEG